MSHYEGRWDCKNCGQTGLLGMQQKSCPGCGMGQPKDVKFYLPSNTPALTDPKLIRQATNGPDIVCAYCELGNPASNKNCSKCGAALEEGKVRKTKTYKNTATSQNEVKDVPDLKTESNYNLHAQPLRTEPALQSSPERKFSIFGTAAVVIAAAGIFFIFRTREVKVAVQAHSWERNILVEQYKTVSEEDWDIPARGRVTGSRNAIHHYNSCVHYHTASRQVSHQVQTGTRSYACGTRDNGNGSFSDTYCSEPVYTTQYSTEYYQEQDHSGGDPVYRTLYQYNIDKWVPGQTRTSRGSNQEAYWPELKLAGDGSDKIGNERESGRKTMYKIFLRSGEKNPKTYTLETTDEQYWKTFKLRENYTATITSFGNIKEIRRTTPSK